MVNCLDCSWLTASEWSLWPYGKSFWILLPANKVFKWEKAKSLSMTEIIKVSKKEFMLTQ